MGQIFGYEGHIHEGMQIAIRREAAAIFLGGGYLKASSRWSGSEALAKVCEVIHQHRTAPTMYELFCKVAQALPLRYPLGGDYLAMCDLRGCCTVSDVASIFLQRVVAQQLQYEAEKRPWSAARSHHGAVTPLCWGLSYVTCTCCIVGQYEQKVKFPLGGCACTPKQTSPSRTDLAVADLKAARQGIPALAALSVACHFRQSLQKLCPPFADEEVQCCQMPLGLSGPGGVGGVAAGSDRPWNWPEMKSRFGLYARSAFRRKRREEELPLREMNRFPFSEFKVLRPEAASSTMPLVVGDLLTPVQLHPGMVVEMMNGSQCLVLSENDEVTMVPTSHYWLAAQTLPIYESLQEHNEDHPSHPSHPSHSNSSVCSDQKPGQQEMLEAGDIVKSSEAKLYPEFVPVEAKPSDLIHVLTLDGTLIYTVSEEEVLEFSLETLKRKIFEHLKLSELVKVDLVPGSSEGHVAPEESLASLKTRGGSAPIEFFLTVTMDRGLYAPWVPLATGGFVRFYDRQLHPMLKPIRSPFKQEATFEVERCRLFFDASEFPLLQGLQQKWQELKEEWLHLWQMHRDRFQVFEGQVGWMSLPLKLWGYDIPEHLKLAPKASEAMQAAGLPSLTTFCYSVLEPGCHIRPHREHVGTSGIRAHLGLQIPPLCAVRVGCNALTWREGQWTIFNGDRSHEVLNMEKAADRAVLLIDFGGPVLDPDRWPPWIQDAMRKAGVTFEDAPENEAEAIPGAVHEGEDAGEVKD